MGFLPWRPLWLPSLKPRQMLQLSLTTDTVDTEATAGTEAMVDTVLEDTGDTMASERPRLSLTTDTVDTEATVVDTEAMADTVTAGASMASVRLMPNPRPLLSLTMDMVDTEATVEDMEAMVVMVLATAGATTASVRLRLSPTMAMEVMEDTVDIVLEVPEATEVTVMAMASNMFPNCSNESTFAQP